jgi:heme A synthase
MITGMAEEKRRGLAHWPFRVAMTIAALMLFDQAVFAGQMLGGSFGALNTHHDNATYAAISVLIAAACGVLLRWPGRGPLWPALACVGLFALIGVQMMLGFARTLTLHIPLGVTIILLGAVLVVWAWRYRPTGPSASSREEGELEHEPAHAVSETTVPETTVQP